LFQLTLDLFCTAAEEIERIHAMLLADFFQDGAMFDNLSTHKFTYEILQNPKGEINLSLLTPLMNNVPPEKLFQPQLKKEKAFSITGKLSSVGLPHWVVELNQ
jgi:hypothetical protein